YPTQGRNGGGVVTHKPTGRTGPVISALLLPAEPPEEVVVLPRNGAVQVMSLSDIPVMGRGVQGKQVVNLSAGNAVVAVKTVRAAMTHPPISPLPPPTPAAANGP